MSKERKQFQDTMVKRTARKLGLSTNAVRVTTAQRKGADEASRELLQKPITWGTPLEVSF